jgi:hypothetical protein
MQRRALELLPPTLAVAAHLGALCTNPRSRRGSRRDADSRAWRSPRSERGYVASGGDEQRFYPWSEPPSASEIDPTRAVFGAPHVEAVGARPRGDGRWRHADLAGNVWEWTLDSVAGAALLSSVGAGLCGSEGYSSPCIDCASLGPAPKRGLRGGDFGMPGPGMIASSRRAEAPTLRQSVFRLRCARATAEAEAAPPPIDAVACVPRCEQRNCGPDVCGVCGDDAACGGAGRCVAYPSTPPRFAEGAVIPSHGFTGVARPAAGDRTLRTVALADFYNPTGRALFPAGSPWAEAESAARGLRDGLVGGVARRRANEPPGGGSEIGERRDVPARDARRRATRASGGRAEPVRVDRIPRSPSLASSRRYRARRSSILAR